jgi:hypothetical protein
MRRGAALELARKIAGRARVERLRRTSGARRRHRSRTQLTQDLLPGFGLIAGMADAHRIEHEAGGPQSFVVTGRAVLRDGRLRFCAGVGHVRCGGSRRLDAGVGRILRETLGVGHEQAPTQSRERDAGDETPSRHDAHDSVNSRLREPLPRSHRRRGNSLYSHLRMAAR